MQFIRNGPDIPEALLQAHEEGRVVFCDAGISCPAWLPDFGGLVQLQKQGIKLITLLQSVPNTSPTAVLI